MSTEHRTRHTRPRLWWAGPAALLLAIVVAPTSAAADSGTGFVNGDGQATASFFDLKIHLGALDATGLALGFGSGRALAQYQDADAASEGEALDYSLLSIINQQPTPQCPNYVPLFLASTAPPLTRADSSDPGADASQLTTVKYAGFPTYGPVFGTQDAVAGPGITSSSVTDAPLVDSGVVKLLHPRSTASTSSDGSTRTATATMSADSLSLMGGAVMFSHPNWTATAKSGATTVAQATFTYSSLTFLGITRPGNNPADLTAVKGWMESTFDGLGMVLNLPTATITPGPNGTGTVAISPLTVGLENLPLGQQVLSGVLHAISPQLDAALKNYLSNPCSNQSYELLVPVLEGFASGKGSLGFSVGGASAMTDDVYYPPVTFDSGVSDASQTVDTTPVASAVPLAPSSAFTEPSSGIGDVSSPTTIDTTPPTTDTTPTTAPPDNREVADAPQPREADLQPASDRSLPGHTGGTAGWLMVAALIAVVGLAGADQFVMRRSRRKFTT